MLEKLDKLVKFRGKSLNLPEKSLLYGTSEYLAVSFFEKNSLIQTRFTFVAKNYCDKKQRDRSNWSKNMPNSSIRKSQHRGHSMLQQSVGLMHWKQAIDGT